METPHDSVDFIEPIAGWLIGRIELQEWLHVPDIAPSVQSHELALLCPKRDNCREISI
jgi:hypothetical protein